MLDKYLITSELETSHINPDLILFDSLDSTNKVAKEMLQNHAREGTIVAATNQQKGRGRYDRIWHSPAGSLYMSVILKPENPSHELPLLSILMGCACVDAINGLFDIDVGLKWPNDLIVNERKLGGILSELVIVRNQIRGVILGVGINQNVNEDDFPAELRKSTTSIQMELGHPTSIELLIAAIINNVDERLSNVSREDTYESIIREFRELCITIGRDILVQETNNSWHGTAVGIGIDGSLEVRDEYDRIRRVRAGEIVHILHEES
jgi:BirA family biotin operon repressor/biotin-[acetyl-CoA-carboxylase] ligase